MPLFACMPNYMEQYLRRTHPRIQNPDRLSPGTVFPLHSHIPPVVVLDVLDSCICDDDLDYADTGDARIQRDHADCPYASTVLCLDFLRIIVLYYVCIFIQINYILFLYITILHSIAQIFLITVSLGQLNINKCIFTKQKNNYDND